MDLSLLEHFGAELRQAREASGRSVDEIAKQTRIHRRYIEAIEAGDANALPPGPYVPAFLREFARAVGLKVPTEFAITSSINHGLTTTTIQSAPIIKNQQAANPLGIVSKAADDTAQFIGNVAKTTAKTTGTVIKGVGEGVNDAVGVFTSRSLREEADAVRRERLGLTKYPSEGAESNGEVIAESNTEENGALHIERLSESGVTTKAGSNTKAVKSPIIPLEISSEDPISGEATLKLGKAQKKFPVTNVVIVVLLLVFSAVAYLAISNMKAQKRGDTIQELNSEELAAPSEASTGDEATPEVASTTPNVTAPAPITDDSLRFVLKATDAVWVSIGPDDAAPFRGELKAGDTKAFAAADRFTVNIGNQKALEMTFNGTRLSNLPTIKNSGMVVRNLVLTRDRVSLNGSEVSTGVDAKPSTSTTLATKPGATSTTTKKPVSTTAVAKKPAQKKITVPKRTTTITPTDPVPAKAD